MDALTDTILINRCVEGNQDAWNELISRYERLIYHAALRAGASSEEAMEIFQNVCLIWLKELKNVRNKSSLGAWLITITRRECSAYWRSQLRQGRNQEATKQDSYFQEPSPEALAAQAEDERAIRLSLQGLHEPCRQLLWLLFFHPGKPSYKEIARKLRIPINSIGPTRGRCLERLKKLLLQSGW